MSSHRRNSTEISQDSDDARIGVRFHSLPYQPRQPPVWASRWGENRSAHTFCLNLSVVPLRNSDICATTPSYAPGPPVVFWQAGQGHVGQSRTAAAACADNDERGRGGQANKRAPLLEKVAVRRAACELSPVHRNTPNSTAASKFSWRYRRRIELGSNKAT